MARSGYLSIDPTGSAALDIWNDITHSIVLGDSTFGYDSGGFYHDTTTSSGGHTSKMDKVEIGSVSVIGGVYTSAQSYFTMMITYTCTWERPSICLEK